MQNENAGLHGTDDKDLERTVVWIVRKAAGEGLNGPMKQAGMTFTKIEFS